MKSYRTYERNFLLPLAALPPTGEMSPVLVNATADSYRIRDGHHRVAARPQCRKASIKQDRTWLLIP